jgi:hypothetical protein
MHIYSNLYVFVIHTYTYTLYIYIYIYIYTYIHTYIHTYTHVAMDSASPNDVVVASIEVDKNNGDVYVLATANKTTAAASNGTMAVMGKHFHKRGFVIPGFGPGGSGYWSGGSKDEFVLENYAKSVFGGSTQFVYTVLARIDVRGVVKWITMIDSLAAIEGRCVHVYMYVVCMCVCV